MPTVELRVSLRSTDGPLYVQIAAAIRRALQEQQVPPGSVIQTAGALADSLDVNVNTVLRAYRLVADEALLQLRRGHGPVVRAAPEEARLHELAEALARDAAQLGLSRGELVALVLTHA